MFAPAPALQPALAVQPAGIVGQDDVEGYDTSDVECGFDEDGSRESKVNPETDGRTKLLQFSRAILELIGANNVKQTHVLAVLREVRKRFGPCSHTGNVVPDTMWLLKKHANYRQSGQGAQVIPVCKNDHPGDRDAQNCAQCGVTLLTRWPRQMVSLDIQDRITRFMAVPECAKAFLYAAEREEGLQDGDMWDGQVAAAIPAAKRRDIVYIGITTDATEFGRTKSAALTPCVGIVLNFPPGMRSTFSALLLLALFPEKVLPLSHRAHLSAILLILIFFRLCRTST